MGIFLIFVTIAAIGLILIGLWLYGENCISKESTYNHRVKSFIYYYDEELLGVGVILLIIAVIPMIITGAVAIGMTHHTEIPIKDAQEYDTLMSMPDEEKDTLSYRVRVEKYNAKIEKAEKDLNSYWIGWYVDRGLLRLPKIKEE